MCVRLLCAAKHRRGYVEEFIVLFPSYIAAAHMSVCAIKVSVNSQPSTSGLLAVE